MEYSTFGRHVAVDTWGVDFDLLNNAELLKTQMVEAAEACGATVLAFKPNNLNLKEQQFWCLLSESHLSIHTYPERGFAALDCYTCGETVDPQLAIDYMVSVLKPEKVYAKKLVRGMGEMQVVEPEIKVAELANK